MSRPQNDAPPSGSPLAQREQGEGGPRTRARVSSSPKTQQSERLSHLTAAQRAAVTSDEGPVLVIAGAGTGKTRVLVERIAWLVSENSVPPQNILALTFTEKAATELQERVDTALPISAFQPWIGTFHGFCESVLREEALAIGLNPRFRILSAPEAWLLVKRQLFTFPLKTYRPLGNPTKFVASLVEFFAMAKDQGFTPDALAAYARAQNDPAQAARWTELAATYRAYVDLQRQEGVMDFGDLVLETLRLFRERPEVDAKYRQRYPQILVDEFQDTNTTQGALLEALAAQTGNLVVVSDDDQAIYAFRGSNIQNILAFRERFPKSTVIVLTENFRSPQPLLDHAYTLIQHNNPHRLEATASVSKRLTAQKGVSAGAAQEEPVVDHRHFSTEEEEFSWIAEETLRLVDGGIAYRDIAILLRTNAQAADLVPSLLRRDIPHVTTEARGLLSRPEVKDSLSYFRLLADPTDARALYRLLTHPALNVTDGDRTILLEALRTRRGPVLPLLQDANLSNRLVPVSRPGLHRLADLLAHHVREFRTLQPSHVYLEFLERSGVLKTAVNASAQHPEVLPNLQAFLTYIRALERGLGAGEFLEFFDIMEAAAEGGEGPATAQLPPETDAIRILTVHGAKGLEFPYIFIAGASADRFPARGRTRPLELPADIVPAPAGTVDLDDRAQHVLEERRLFYVALTRAQRRLVLTSSTAAAGARMRRKPSPFITEAEIPSRAAAAPGGAQQVLALPPPAVPVRVKVPEAAARLSASKIAEYLQCPKKYEFRYVLNVPVPPQPVLSFGTTIHDVLRDVAREVLAGRSPTIENVLTMYERNWQADGYESPAYEAERKTAGQRALRAYLTQYPELLTRSPLAVEAPFSVALATTRLSGRIDRIDKLEDGRILVTDFKTGEGKMRDAASDIQISIYALALRRAFRLDPSELRLSYVETGREDATTRPPEQDADTAQRVEDIAARIRAGDFHATPGFLCRFCDFRNICDDAQLP